MVGVRGQRMRSVARFIPPPLAGSARFLRSPAGRVRPRGSGRDARSGSNELFRRRSGATGAEGRRTGKPPRRGLATGRQRGGREQVRLLIRSFELPRGSTGESSVRRSRFRRSTARNIPRSEFIARWIEVD